MLKLLLGLLGAVGGGFAGLMLVTVVAQAVTPPPPAPMEPLAGLSPFFTGLAVGLPLGAAAGGYVGVLIARKLKARVGADEGRVAFAIVAVVVSLLAFWAIMERYGGW